MDTQKYKDMAVGNPQGKRWIKELKSPEVAKLYKKYLGNLCPNYPMEYLITESVWYFGYAQEPEYNIYKRMNKYGVTLNARTLFTIFDNFLEKEVRWRTEGCAE